jgi:hypothetical protein
VHHIAVGHRIGLVEDLEEDMKAVEARRIVAVVVVDSPAEDSLVEGNPAEDSFAEGNFAEGNFAEGSSAEGIAAGHGPEGGMKAVELDTVALDVVHTAAAVEGLEGRAEGDVGHMDVATDLKFS